MSTPPEYPQFTVPPSPDQSAAVNWTTVEDPSSDTMQPTSGTETPEPHTQEYYPLSETIRLYAGWQLALYLLVYGVGYYQSQSNLPFRIPYIDALLVSPILMTATLACFCYLLCTDLQKKHNLGKIFSWVIGITFMCLFIFYRSNV